MYEYNRNVAGYSEHYIEAPKDEISITFLCISIMRLTDLQYVLGHGISSVFFSFSTCNRA